MADGPQIASSFLDFVDKYAPPKLRPPAFLVVAIALGIAWYYNRTQTTLGIAAALALLAFLLTLGGLAKVTRRKVPFKTSAAEFVGRDTEVTEIAGDIVEHRLVFVTGQSGCGKSTLIEHGVAAVIGRSGRRTVLLCQYLGEDWESGPADAIADRLDGVLTQDERTKLGLHPQLSIDDLMQALRSCKGVLDREPVLVFDQFDDYQLLHSARFVRRSRVLSPEKLTAENSFSRGIAQLLKDHAVRCVFVTRDDARPRLSAVEFQSPEEFELEPLDRRFAEEYLARVSEGVLEDPDATWPALRRRVMRDLETDGKILPIRLISVVAGLEELNALSLREYERAGNLIGLEARALAMRIRRAAGSVGLSYEQALPLLVFLVSGRKTVPRSLDELSGKLPVAAGSGEQATKLLERLSDERVVRPVSEERGRDTLWKLYHDYLSEPVAELQRRADYWQFALEEALDRYQAAKGPVARFRALAPPLRQLRFWFEASRGRVRLGHATGYMQRSLVRFVLNAGMPVIALAFWAGAREADRRTADEARVLFDQYSSASEKSAEWSRALWELDSAPARVKSALVGQTLRSEAAAQLIAQDHAVVTAVAGRFSPLVKPQWLARAIDGLCDPGKPRSLAVANTCLAWMWGGATTSSCTGFLVAEMRRRKDLGEVIALSGWLETLGSRVPEEVAGELAEKLVAEMRHEVVAMQQEGNPSKLYALEGGLRALGSSVPEAKAGELAGELAEMVTAALRRLESPRPQIRVQGRVVAQPRDLSEFSALSSGLEVLGSRVPEATAGELFLNLVAEMPRGDRYPHSILADDLLALGSRGGEAKAGERAEKLVTEMRQRTDPYEISALASGLRALGSHVPADKTAAAAEKLWAEMRQRTDPHEISALVSGLGALGSHVPADKTAAAAEKLLAEMRQEKDQEKLSAMASGLGALGSRVPEAKIVEAAEKLVAEMRQREDPYQLSILARGLGGLGSRVPADKTAAAAERLVAEMRHRMSLSELSALEISALRRRFPAQLVHGSLSAFLALDRSTLARALGELGSRVPEAAADEAAEILVAEMRQRKDSADLQALGAFAARSSDAKASTLLPDTLDRILAPRLWDCGMVAGLFRRQQTSLILRSEERRVGKECRSRWS